MNYISEKENPDNKKEGEIEEKKPPPQDVTKLNFKTC